MALQLKDRKLPDGEFLVIWSKSPIGRIHACFKHQDDIVNTVTPDIKLENFKLVAPMLTCIPATFPRGKYAGHAISLRVNGGYGLVDPLLPIIYDEVVSSPVVPRELIELLLFGSLTDKIVRDSDFHHLWSIGLYEITKANENYKIGRNLSEPKVEHGAQFNPKELYVEGENGERSTGIYGSKENPLLPGLVSAEVDRNINKHGFGLHKVSAVGNERYNPAYR